MKVTVQLSTESAEMAAKISEVIGVSPNVIVSRMVNSQLEAWNGLYEYINPAGSGPVSLNIPPGNPHQPRANVPYSPLEPEQDFAKLDEKVYPPYEKIYGPGDKPDQKPIRERLTKEEFLKEYEPPEGC